MYMHTHTYKDIHQRCEVKIILIYLISTIFVISICMLYAYIILNFKKPGEPVFILFLA